MTISLLTAILLLLTITFQTINRLVTKYAVTRVDPLSIFIFGNLITGSLFGVLIINSDISIPELSFQSLVLLFLAILCWAIFGYIYNLALTETSLSVFTILTQLQILLVTTLGIVFLGHTITSGLVVGVICIITGSILVTYQKNSSYEISRRGLLLTLIVAISGASAIFLDSLLVKYFNPLLYGFIIIVFSTLPFLLIYKNKVHDFSKKSLKIYLLCGVSFFFAYMTPLYLYRQPDLLITYAYPILRAGAILSVLLSILIFKEHTNWKYKIIAILLASFGAVCIKLM
ncbi:MAG: hypothetical protein RI935_127 [Candidatus Parcubacteria bacterium]|jgi:drug/metabolite transporter (DMT)-like permease